MEDGWESVSRRREQKRAEPAGAQSRKPYSAFDPSTWYTDAHSTSRGSAPAPAVVAASDKPRPKQSAGKPVAPPPPERTPPSEADTEKKHKPKKPKEAPRSQLEACCEKILLHSTADGSMAVPELSMALAKAMGFSSWKAKYKPFYGSFPTFLAKSRTLAVVSVDGEERVVLADAVVDVPFQPLGSTAGSSSGGNVRRRTRALPVCLRVVLVCVCVLSGSWTLEWLEPPATLCVASMMARQPTGDQPTGDHVRCVPWAHLALSAEAQARRALQTTVSVLEDVPLRLESAGSTVSTAVSAALSRLRDEASGQPVTPVVVGGSELIAAALILCVPRTGAAPHSARKAANCMRGPTRPTRRQRPARPPHGCG